MKLRSVQLVTLLYHFAQSDHIHCESNVPIVPSRAPSINNLNWMLRVTLESFITSSCLLSTLSCSINLLAKSILSFFDNPPVVSCHLAHPSVRSGRHSLSNAQSTLIHDCPASLSTPKMHVPQSFFIFLGNRPALQARDYKRPCTCGGQTYVLLELKGTS